LLEHLEDSLDFSQVLAIYSSFTEKFNTKNVARILAMNSRQLEIPTNSWVDVVTLNKFIDVESQ
jgi:hypothetical protein